MIRPATMHDIPALLELGRAMHAESPVFRWFAWSNAKVGELIEWLIASDDGLALVYDDGGAIVAGFLGVITEQFFSHDRFAQDYALFVAPTARGTNIGRKLVLQYRAWAAAAGVPATIGVSTGVEVEATGMMLESCGFDRYGALYEARA